MKQKDMARLFFFIIIATILVQSCYYDKEELLYPGSTAAVDCTTINAKFGADVQPLITSKCATSGCHDATAAGGITLENYAQISGAKDRVNARSVVEKTMPSSGPLQQSEVNIIKCWIESGALNN